MSTPAELYKAAQNADRRARRYAKKIESTLRTLEIEELDRRDEESDKAWQAYHDAVQNEATRKAESA